MIRIQLQRFCFSYGRFETSPVTYRKIKPSGSLECDKLSHPILNMHEFMLFDFSVLLLKAKEPLLSYSFG